MKHYFFMFGAAALLMTGCVTEKVTDVASNRTIVFDQFVNNNTKAVTEVTTANLQQYYVFGEFGESEGNYDTPIFQNELQTTQYYWVENKFYSFGAYANGNNGKIENAAFDAATGKLTFENYTVKDETDLVAAVATATTDADVTDENDVALTFKHMLSQVKFSFTTSDGENYTLAISNLKFEAAATGNGTYNGTVSWTGAGNGEYIYDDIADVSSSAYAPQSKLVIPQGGTDALKVTFTATITGAGLNKSANFESTLAIAANIAGTSEANTWMPGYRYNYTAEINADTIDPSLESQKITFAPTVEEWKDADDQNANPTVQP